jgi:hypothetical protein
MPGLHQATPSHGGQGVNRSGYTLMEVVAMLALLFGILAAFVIAIVIIHYAVKLW